MSDKQVSSTPRGAPAKPKGVPMALFYALLGLITIAGVILLLSNTQTLHDSAVADVQSRQRSSSRFGPGDSCPACLCLQRIPSQILAAIQRERPGD